jgi:lipoprotein-anchoring transpeptidase ErfK/SrfK
VDARNRTDARTFLTAGAIIGAVRPPRPVTSVRRAGGRKGIDGKGENMDGRYGGRRSPRAYAFGPLLALIGVVALLLSPALVAAQGSGGQLTTPSRSAPWSPPSTVYIPETGQTIDGVFLDFWRTNGGIANYGYPITPELDEDGRVVQYYQYARLEYWPDDPDGNVVHLGDIGLELRPHMVLRTAPVVTGGGAGTTPTNTGNELAKMARAWLPLGEKDASRPNTDTWRYVPETKHSVQFGFKTLWESTGEADYLGNPLSEEFILSGITYQVFERGQLAWEQANDPWIVPLGEQLAKRYKLDTNPQDQGDVPTYDEELFVPPPTPEPGSGGEHWIEVNLSAQYLIAWEGDIEVNSTYVSTGRPGFDTPTGTFYINTKLESDDMEGVLGGEYYNVPAVPWVMYFTDVGHALHGTYWHSNFGSVMSHGCVNLPMDFAEWLYYWADYGTRVEIHY